jgi:hypothetical protein
MIITSTDIAEITSLIAEHVGDQPAMISIAEECPVSINDLIKSLNESQVQFMGGIFPKVIHDNNLHGDAIVLNTLRNLHSIHVVEGLSTESYSIPAVGFEDKDYSLLTFVDGLTSKISGFLGALYENYGMKTNYFGGGAGSLSLQQQPCVFTNKGFFQDAAVFAILRTRSSIGVKHGWNKIGGPYIITSAEGNVIKGINWKNPFEVYKECVESNSDHRFNENNFFDIAKGFPFGVVKNEAESVVRDPLTVNEKGELICVGELEDNTLVDILNGNKESLVEAARQATSESIKGAHDPSKAIVIDCISRVLFLEDDFMEELNAITSTVKEAYPEVSINGALTLGEISSYGEGFLEFYNKTTVVGLFEK